MVAWQFISLFGGGVVSNACRLWVLQIVHFGFRAVLKYQFGISCRTAMCLLDWAALRPEVTSISLRCVRWGIACVIYKQPVDAISSL